MEQNGVHIVNGVKVPPFVTQERLDKLKDFPLFPDDIWIVTYPKTGTTWTSQIIKLIQNGGKDNGQRVTTSVPWMEALDYYPEINLEQLPTPRVLRSHFSYDLMPCGLPNKASGRYIYVIRNPKDVAVSFFHHSKSLIFEDQEDLVWDNFFGDFLAGQILYGSYFDHVLSWWAHRSDENILFVKYEDMKRDLLSVVTRIAKFIGSNVDEEVIKEIAFKTSFEQMKDNQLANLSWSRLRRQGSVPFMRKGEVGDWRNYFSEEQSKRVDAIYSARFKPVGLELEFAQ